MTVKTLMSLLIVLSFTACQNAEINTETPDIETVDVAQTVSTKNENKQALATSPAELVARLSEASFYKPDIYRKKIDAEMGAHSAVIGLPPLPQLLDPATDPRRDITAAEIRAYADVLTDIAVQSREDGEILWGRIQGTQYERQALSWIEDTLKAFGLAEVHYDAFPSQFPQWRPTRNTLTITQAPGFGHTETFTFTDAITAFESATTVKGGIEAELIYVGDGTASELHGRNIEGKLVLLRARTQPSALLNSARTAYSRIASGTYGTAAGVIIWWDVPRARQVAGRVGAPGGGDSIGRALPWTSIGNDDGLYLRKLLDYATESDPVRMKLDVQGHMETGTQRMSGNVYGILPGRSDTYIVIPTHVDGYFYGLFDNGSSVALNLALARHYAELPLAQRSHGLIFLFQGDHEVPGVGGTLPFIDKNRALMEENLLLVLRPEHLGMIRPMDEGFFWARSNITDPLALLVTNRSPKLIDIFKQAATEYTIPMGDFVYVDPAADEAAFHPPYNDLGAISAGWIQTGKFYHSTADIDADGVHFEHVEKLARAHAFIIDELADVSKTDLEAGGKPVPETSIYQSDLMKILLGDN